VSDSKQTNLSAALLVDTHCHLDMFSDEEIPGLLGRAGEAGVVRVISVAVDIESAGRAIGLAADNPEVFATIGVHPHEARGVTKATMADLKALARRPKVVAVGETGLDYHYLHSSKAAQIESLKRHIDLAAEVALPLIVHCREAFDDLALILDQARPPKVVLHCFSGGPAEAAVFLALNCYISMAGTVTFNNALPIQEAAAEVPAERLMLETDAPYLAPQPHRGKRNEPAYIRETAAKLSLLRGLPVEEVVKDAAAVADGLFGLELASTGTLA